MAENGTSGFTVTPYEYGDGTWADLLTKYGSTAIAYDEIGNPLNGKASNMTYTWDKGRNLVQYNFRSYSTSYTYNADGLRTSKTYYQSSSISKSTEYFIVDGRYVGEISTVGNIDYVIAYVYDENGAPAGINVNGTQYWFVKNLQGDVTAILDSNGAVVAVYTYSAWGVKVSVKDADGNNITSTSHVARLNPFRYRGYMYDEETGYYYLRSRYYNPEMGRFLNADGLVSTGQGLDGHNMFAYCGNNPVLRIDDNGEFYHIIIGAAIGGISSFVSTLITGGSLSDALISAAFGSASGALTAAFPAFGALIGAGFGAAESVVLDVKNKEDNEYTVTDIVINATISAGFGAMSGACESYFMSKSVDADIRGIKTALKGTVKGNHPAVKKSAEKVVKSTLRRIAKEARIYGEDFVSTSAISWGTKEYTRRRVKYMVGA